MSLSTRETGELPQALAGVRIVDFTWVRAGPWATRWLGALGAEVIKVEWPDSERGRGEGIGTPPGVETSLNTSGNFNDTNCNKLGVTLNLRSPKGLDLVKRLISISDVVIENFSARALVNWGLGYDEMLKLKQDIIYVSQAGFGHTGRHSHYTTFGPIAQAFSGLTHQSGLPGKPPAGWGWSYLDDTGGMYMAMATMTALYHRDMTGQGQHVDLSQMIAGITLNGPALLDTTVNGRPSRREGYPPGNRAVWPGATFENNYRGRTAAPHNAYRTKGGGYNDWCAIACFSDEEWQNLVRAMGSPAWAARPEYSSLAGRLRHQEELDRGIQEWTLTLDKYELMERCQVAGVGAMPVQGVEDRVEHDPQLRHREMYTELDHPALGLRKFQNAPFKLSETPAFHHLPSPLIGQHNREVFEGLLELSDEELAEGYEDGTFWPKTRERYPYIEEMLQGGSLPDGEKGRLSRENLGPRAPQGTASESSGNNTRGPLSGIRVLELADEKGEFCGKLMADLGADVIKIEPPGGASSRSVGPFLDDVPHRERSISFWHYNTSKRGVTLNLETSEGRSLFRRLASDADIVLETLRPGRLPSLGLGYQDLKELNPRLIFCSLTPFGQTGPWRDFVTSDLLHLAVGGQMGCCGYDEEDVPDAPPIAGGGGQAWHIGCHYANIAITAALMHRTKSGLGQYIDASIHDSCALTTEFHVANYIYTGGVPLRQTGRHASVTPRPHSQFLCKDGRYMHASVGQLGPRQIGALAEWMDAYGLAGDLQDPGYQDPKVVREKVSHIVDLVTRFAANLTAEELAYGGQERGFGWGLVRTPEDLLEDGHLEDRGFWVDVEHPELERSFKYPGPAGLYNGSPWRIRRRAPLVGEDNQEVYCGELGLQPAELAILAEFNVI